MNCLTSPASGGIPTGGYGRFSCVVAPTPAAAVPGAPGSTEAHTAILEATRAALVELGWSKLTMGDVAGRAGVAKTTLYRRWANKNELVVDAVAVLFDELELPDLGSLQADIEHVVLQFAALLERPETKTALMAVVAEIDPGRAAARAHPRLHSRPPEAAGPRGPERAQQRGELPAGRDPMAVDATDDLIFDVIAGAVVHRALVSAEPVDAPWVARLSALLVGGLGAAAAAGA
ncbi:TetR/AcrR family transcriptional regulator [Streptomyces tanashiensis]